MTLLAIDICAAIAAITAVAALFRDKRSLPGGLFALGMFLLAAEALFIGFSQEAASPDQAMFWHRNRLLVLAALPGAWLAFSLTYGRINFREFLSRWKLLLAGVVVVPMVVVLLFWDSLVSNPLSFLSVAQIQDIRILPAGKLVTGIFLLTVVLVLVNFERTFSASVGTMRWRVKFMLIGLGMLFAFRLYSTSQMLLFNSINIALAIIEVFALGVACLLIVVALVRTRLADIEIYPSMAVLRGSVTAMLAGFYLLIMGLFAKVVAELGGDSAFTLKAFVILVAIAGLGVLLLSDRLHQRMRMAISRHFNRPQYDYRKSWSDFTERTTSLSDRFEFCRAVARLLSETFNSLSVNIWLFDEQTGHLSFAASTLLAENQAGHALKHSNASQLIAGIRRNPRPVDMELATDEWIADLRKWNPDFFLKGGNRICVPLISGGEILGIITLADRVSGVKFSLEDMDLLKCIGDQMAASMHNIRLAEKILRAREMEAFQTMSTFLVHDLKNVAYTLSLMSQNMQQHFDKPEFRADAMKGLSRSVEHLQELISKFGTLRQGLKLNLVECDLNQVIRELLGEFKFAPEIVLSHNLGNAQTAVLDPEQIKKVLVNLIINARDAVGEKGEIKVQTALRDGWIECAVSDTGAGMSAQFLQQNLFKPFQSTKKKGLGIGMFHSKTIIEAHHGRIEVESVPQKGTTFRVLLPVGNNQNK